jgi:hypothetical protein
VSPSRAPLVLLLLGCSHAGPPEEDRARAPGQPPPQPGAPVDPGTAVLTVVWANPSTRYAVACDDNLYDSRQHWLRGASSARASLIERFMIRAGASRIQCFVTEAEQRTKWALFEDAYLCRRGADLRLDLRVDPLPDGRLAFDAAYSSQGCEGLPTPARRPVAPRPDPAPRICCGDPRSGEFRGE